MRRFVAVPLALALVVGACGSGSDGATQEGEGTVAVIASFYPLAEAARRVGGDLVQVADLTPSGVEPHDLELTPDQVDELEDADVVLYLGGGFQPGVEEVAERRDDGALDVLDALALETPDDPHFWLDPVRMAIAVDLVEQELARAAPAQEEEFAANARTYQAELAALDTQFAEGLGTCERRLIVTAHAAFHYLAERYDLEQRPISGLSPESEPDPRRLAELSDLIDEEGVTVVFYETLVDPDVAKTLAREAQVETAVLNPLEGLSDDDLEAGKDYAAVMRENLAVLRHGLGCR